MTDGNIQAKWDYHQISCIRKICYNCQCKIKIYNNQWYSCFFFVLFTTNKCYSSMAKHEARQIALTFKRALQTKIVLPNNTDPCTANRHWISDPNVPLLWPLQTVTVFRLSEANEFRSATLLKLTPLVENRREKREHWNIFPLIQRNLAEIAWSFKG